MAASSEHASSDDSGAADNAAKPSFQEWKQFFLENGMGDPSTATVTATTKSIPPRRRRRGDPKPEARRPSAWPTVSGWAAATEARRPINGKDVPLDKCKDVPVQVAAARNVSTTSPPPAAAAANPDPITEADALLRDRGEDDERKAEQAFRLYEAELEKAGGEGGGAGAATPEAFAELQRKAAAALLVWMRIRTGGNGLAVVEGGAGKGAGSYETTDTPEHRRVWAEDAPSVLQLLKGVRGGRGERRKEVAKDPDVQQIYTEALMYQTSSKGVIQAVAAGDAVAFINAVDGLSKAGEGHDGGVGFIFRGAYLMAAPWPIQNVRKALDLFGRALQVEPASKRNNYYGGLARLALGDYKDAAMLFQKSLESPCASATERDVAGFLGEQARRGLEAAEEALRR